MNNRKQEIEKNEQDTPVSAPEIAVTERIAEGSFGVLCKGKWLSETAAKKYNCKITDVIAIKSIDIYQEKELKKQIEKIKKRLSQESAEDAIKTLRENTRKKTLITCNAELNILKDLNSKAEKLEENDPQKNTIIKFFRSGIFDDNNHSYFCTIMEYAFFGSLSNFIVHTQPGAISEVTKLRWATQIAYGVKFMHDNGYYHRDLKSCNILITADWNVKLTDFDNSKKISDCKRGEQVGSWAWIAPEIIKACPYTDKADIYSMSMIFWQLASWVKAPYLNLSNEAIELRVPDGYRPSLSSVNHPKLAKLITWGWKQIPEERPTIEEVIDTLNKKEVETNNYSCTIV